MEELDDTGISLLPFGKFPTMLVVSDSVGFTSDSPLTSDMTAAFPVAREGRPPQTMRFSEFYTRPGCTPVNASPERSPVQTHHSGPKLMANLYFVRLFHSLLSNDFADAPCSCSCPLIQLLPSTRIRVMLSWLDVETCVTSTRTAQALKKWSSDLSLSGVQQARCDLKGPIDEIT